MRCGDSVIGRFAELLNDQKTARKRPHRSEAIHINLTIIALLVRITAATMLTAVMPASRLISLFMVCGSRYEFAHNSFRPVTLNVIEC